MRIRVFLLLLAMWTLSITAAARAHTQVARGAGGVLVTGVVLDPQGGVIPGAHVELMITGAQTGQTAITDANGAFRFDHVVAGSYDLRVSVEGFEPTIAHLNVGTRAPGPQRVALALANVTQELTVSNGGLLVDTTAGNNLNAIVMDQQALQ